MLGVLRTVLFAPEDLALVKGDPGERRRYLDELLVTRWPRIAGIRADYDRVLRQRTALLKSAGAAMRSGRADTHTLDVWDEHLATTGAELLSARLALLADLRAPADSAYRSVSGGQGDLELGYRSGLPLLAEGVATTPGGEPPPARPCARPCWPRWPSSARASWTAGCASSARTATTWS